MDPGSGEELRPFPMVGVRSRQPKRDMGKGDGDEEWREDGRSDKGKKFMKGKKCLLISPYLRTEAGIWKKSVSPPEEQTKIFVLLKNSRPQ